MRTVGTGWGLFRVSSRAVTHLAGLRVPRSAETYRCALIWTPLGPPEETTCAPRQAGQNEEEITDSCLDYIATDTAWSHTNTACINQGVKKQDFGHPPTGAFTYVGQQTTAGLFIYGHTNAISSAPTRATLLSGGEEARNLGASISYTEKFISLVFIEHISVGNWDQMPAVSHCTHDF